VVLPSLVLKDDVNVSEAVDDDLCAIICMLFSATFTGGSPGTAVIRTARPTLSITLAANAPASTNPLELALDELVEKLDVEATCDSKTRPMFVAIDTSTARLLLPPRVASTRASQLCTAMAADEGYISLATDITDAKSSTERAASSVVMFVR